MTNLCCLITERGLLYVILSVIPHVTSRWSHKSSWICDWCLLVWSLEIFENILPADNFWNELGISVLCLAEDLSMLQDRKIFVNMGVMTQHSNLALPNGTAAHWERLDCWIWFNRPAWLSQLQIRVTVWGKELATCISLCFTSFPD